MRFCCHVTNNGEDFGKILNFSTCLSSFMPSPAASTLEEGCVMDCVWKARKFQAPPCLEDRRCLLFFVSLSFLAKLVSLLQRPRLPCVQTEHQTQRLRTNGGAMQCKHRHSFEIVRATARQRFSLFCSVVVLSPGGRASPAAVNAPPWQTSITKVPQKHLSTSICLNRFI